MAGVGTRPSRPRRGLTVSAAQGNAAVSEQIAEAVRLCSAGLFKDALRLASGALRAHPESAVLWNVSAGAAFGLGMLDDAQRFWSVAIARDPAYAEAHYNLGVLHHQCGRLDAAARSLSRAVTLQPSNAPAHNNLGVVLLDCRRFREAVVLLQRAVELDPTNAEALNNLGLAQIEVGALAAARINLDRAIALKPDLAQALNTRGMLQVETGALEAGAEDLDAALRIDPDYGQAHLNRALVSRAKPGAPWVAGIQAAYERRLSLPSGAAAAIAFAAGKVREDLGEFDAAFDAYAEGNRLRHALQPFDEAEDCRTNDALLRSFDRQLYAGILPPQNSPSMSEAPRHPIFVVGMPRSGTSLIEQILASHPEIRGAGELTLLSELVASLPPGVPEPAGRASWIQTLRELGAQYLEGVWSTGVSSFVVDKMPGNYRHVGLMPLMLPKARIIHVVRDAADTCFSCFATSFRRGHEYSYDLAVLGRYYQRYARLMQHWRSILPPGVMIDVRYEELVQDIEGQSRRMLAHLGLPWHERCLRFYENDRPVSTASFAQVRERAYTRSIARWKRFERHLAPLLGALSTPER